MSESENEFPEIKKGSFDIRKFKKKYRNRYNALAFRCRITKSEKEYSLFRENIRRILELTDEALRKDVTYNIGNVYYLIGILEDLFSFMTDMSNRVNTVEEKDLYLVYESIDDKIKEVEKKLEDNLKTPVSLSDLRNG